MFQVFVICLTCLGSTVVYQICVSSQFSFFFIHCSPIMLLLFFFFLHITHTGDISNIFINKQKAAEELKNPLELIKNLQYGCD